MPQEGNGKYLLGKIGISICRSIIVLNRTKMLKQTQILNKIFLIKKLFLAQN